MASYGGWEGSPVEARRRAPCILRPASFPHLFDGDHGGRDAIPQPIRAEAAPPSPESRARRRDRMWTTSPPLAVAISPWAAAIQPDGLPAAVETLRAILRNVASATVTLLEQVGWKD